MVNIQRAITPAFEFEQAHFGVAFFTPFWKVLHLISIPNFLLQKLGKTGEKADFPFAL